MKCPVRACVGVQIFFACCIVYMIRVSISINLLAMVKERGKGKASTSECIPEKDKNKNTTTKLEDFGPRYDWSRAEQGLVLGAYYYGYLITCAPGGYLADRFGATKVTLISTILGGVLTAVIPLCAMVHVWVVVIMRFLVGLVGGVVYPAVQSMIARWAPPAEKGKFVAALMGNTMGTMLTWPLLGVVIETIGWVWAFIIPGIIAIAWGIIWCFTVADSPNDHKFISEEERDFINDSLSGGIKKVKKAPPYLKIFSNIPFWALVVAHFGNLWGLYLLTNNGPMYLKEVLGFDLKSSGTLATLPYLARLVFGIIFGSIGDYIRKRELMSITFMRKFFTFFSHIMPGLLMLTVMFAGCNAAFAVTVIMMSLGFNGASTITNLQNCQDLAPNFAGTIFGLINFIGTTTGFITPSLTSYITRERSSVPEWNIIYGIGGCVYIGCALVFIVFGSGNKQPFNDVAEQEATTG